MTLTLAVASFMAVFGIFFSLNETINNIFESTDYQIGVSPTEGQDFEQVRSLLKEQVSEVDEVYPGVQLTVDLEGYVDAQFGGNSVFVTGFDPASDVLDWTLEEGTAWEEDPNREGIVLTTSLAEQIGKRLGDIAVIEVGGQATELEVIGLVSFPFDQGFMEWRQLARLAGLTLGAPTPNEYALPVLVEGYSGTLPGGQVIVLGFDEMIGGFLDFQAGSSFTQGEPGVIISTDMAELGGYNLGDRLSLSAGENTVQSPIVGVFNAPPQMSASGSPPDVVGMHWTDLAALEGRDLTGQPTPNSLLVQTRLTDPTADEVDGVIDRISDLLVAQGMTATFSNQVASAEESAQQILSIGMIFTITALVMAAVGAIGLLATLSMAVFERQKEIGVMRSIGAGSLTVAGQFLVEGILVGFISWVVGAPLSILLSQLLADALPFGVTDIEYPPISLVIGLVGILLIATVSSLWPSISAARKTVSEIIRYQ
jgi:ABC-type lipoprotein release transport system permease subunit